MALPAAESRVLRLYCSSQRSAQILRDQRAAASLAREWASFAAAGNKSTSGEAVNFGEQTHLPTLKVTSESCFHLVLRQGESSYELWQKWRSELSWLLGHGAFSADTLTTAPTIPLEAPAKGNGIAFEIGPRPHMTTPFSTNAVSILHSMGLGEVVRLELSQRYAITLNQRSDLADEGGEVEDHQLEALLLNPKDGRLREEIFAIFGDRMTQCEYTPEASPMEELLINPPQRAPHKVVHLGDLRRVNEEQGLGFDKADLEFYTDLFAVKLGRNPTDVELFDMAQSNSEHSRHWFFKGDLIVDGVRQEKSLFSSVQSTLEHSDKNNLIAFSDNSSAIRGFEVPNLALKSEKDRTSCALATANSPRHIVYTAETHNFPTGAATGAGGRIRDVHATGRGAHEIAGVAGYAVGNLGMHGLSEPCFPNYPRSFASPLKILLEASDGASDYGNKFGEPLIAGFCRSYGAQHSYEHSPALPSNGKEQAQQPLVEERVEYIKPIMFSGGLGAIDECQLNKAACHPGQLVGKIGGPVYRIGVGGGSASSIDIQGTRDGAADYGAVQRGDPEMEQKLHRLIRACIERGTDNPILSIHDQGAGGNGNVLKEILEGDGGGAIINADAFELGDPSVSLFELWGAEYQESDAILVEPTKLGELEAIAKRERCPLSIVGKVDGSGRVILTDFGPSEPNPGQADAKLNSSPVDLDLRAIGARENKRFMLSTNPYELADTKAQLLIPPNLQFGDILEMVLQMPTVGSKRFLTSKVDRSVGGLVAQQQCVGPLHTPIADVACVALSFWATVGAAVGVGEQPIKGLSDPKCGARMSVGEALTNLVAAPITALREVKCSANWMWPAKLQGEGAKLVSACEAMCQVMKELGIAVDGGKDSLGMAASFDNGEVVKSPGTLVISAYAPCVNVCGVVTPDLKTPSAEGTMLLHLPMSSQPQQGCNIKTERLGGSALAQCLGTYGGIAPDLDNAAYFAACFNLVQQWIGKQWLLSIHDISDGGLIVAVLETAFAGSCSLACDFARDSPPSMSGEKKISADELKWLFSEELGLIIEIERHLWPKLSAEALERGIHIERIGEAKPARSPASVTISVSGRVCFEQQLGHLREVWERTSDRIEELQIHPKCLSDQRDWRQNSALESVRMRADYEWDASPSLPQAPTKAPLVAILREEGSNGDREMAACFMMAGFEAHDLTMTDVQSCAERGALHSLLLQFSGIAFVGGFSYADVLGSAKGWAAGIRFNKEVRSAFQAFRQHPHKFSLGVCNGCQVMSLLGFVGDLSIEEQKSIHDQPSVFLDDNESGRFYSGFNTVRIEDSPSVLLAGMSGAVLGVWCSHGEGKFTYRNDAILKGLEDKRLIALRYCDAAGEATMRYPENPNGSKNSIGGICSPDGRHLALMPHPERAFLRWQWPNYPDFFAKKYPAVDCLYTPWMRLFKNAKKVASIQ